MDIKGRGRVYINSVRWGWGVIGFIVIAIPNFYDYVSAQYFPDNDLPTMRDIVGWWDWKVWIITGLGIIIIGILEGAYRYTQKIKSENHRPTESERNIRINLAGEAYKSNVIWGLWHTGVTARQNKSEVFPRLKRLLFQSG